jgi:hypothetical protein
VLQWKPVSKYSTGKWSEVVVVEAYLVYDARSFVTEKKAGQIFVHGTDLRPPRPPGPMGNQMEDAVVVLDQLSQAGYEVKNCVHFMAQPSFCYQWTLQLNKSAGQTPSAKEIVAEMVGK